MQIPKKFSQHDEHQLLALISDYPFATLITHGNLGIDANHIPLLYTCIQGRGVLQGHIAKANPLWKNHQHGAEALAVFSGPNCYISPNYYPTKKEHGKAVPTWNYISVHVRGSISFIHDPQWNLRMIDHLTQRHEARQPVPWSTKDAPQDYIDKMLAVIVGLEIEITSITGQWKLSQNQPEVNRRGIVAGLGREKGENAQKIAALVDCFAPLGEKDM